MNLTGYSGLGHTPSRTTNQCAFKKGVGVACLTVVFAVVLSSSLSVRHGLETNPRKAAAAEPQTGTTLCAALASAPTAGEAANPASTPTQFGYLVFDWDSRVPIPGFGPWPARDRGSATFSEDSTC